MPQHRQKVDDIVECLNKSVQDILNNPGKYENDSKAVYGMLAKIPDEAVV